MTSSPDLNNRPNFDELLKAASAEEAPEPTQEETERMVALATAVLVSAKAESGLTSSLPVADPETLTSTEAA